MLSDFYTRGPGLKNGFSVGKAFVYCSSLVFYQRFVSFFFGTFHYLTVESLYGGIRFRINNCCDIQFCILGNGKCASLIKSIK